MSTAPAVPFDPYSPEVIADPYPRYAELRALGPVHQLADGTWMVVGYDEVVALLRDPSGFSSAAGMGALMSGQVGSGRPAAENPFGISSAQARVLIATDPPDHTALRRMVSRAFTPRAVAAIEPRLRSLCDDLVDGLLERTSAGETVDLTAAVAMPFPVTVIAELLGIPAERRDDFKRWSDALVGTLAGQVDLRGAAAAMGELTAFVLEQIGLRRSEPTDDLIGRLVALGELGVGDLVAFVILLLVAGNETTTNLIGNGAQAFADHPDQLDRLIADPSLLPSTVEEVLRFDGPVQALFRGTTTEVEVGGTVIPAGSMVMVSFAAANHDGAHFPDPERFDIARNPQDHLGFGHGIHFCLGASLARLEFRLVAESMLARGARLRAAGGAERLTTAVLRGFRSFPVAAA